MREFVARWKDMFIRMGAMPVSFLGVGLYRAWLATFFRYERFRPLISSITRCSREP